MTYGSRFSLGEHAQTPSYRHDEHRLGYETDMIFSNGHGLPLENMTMLQVPSTRKTNSFINQFIKA